MTTAATRRGAAPSSSAKVSCTRGDASAYGGAARRTPRLAAGRSKKSPRRAPTDRRPARPSGRGPSHAPHRTPRARGGRLLPRGRLDGGQGRLDGQGLPILLAHLRRQGRELLRHVHLAVRRPTATAPPRALSTGDARRGARLDVPATTGGRAEAAGRGSGPRSARPTRRPETEAPRAPNSSSLEAELHAWRSAVRGGDQGAGALQVATLAGCAAREKWRSALPTEPR